MINAVSVQENIFQDFSSVITAQTEHRTTRPEEKEISVKKKKKQPINK
jgi:hypothetical protein